MKTAATVSKPTPDGDDVTDTLQSLGEAELIRRLAHFAPAGQLEDDTATLPATPSAQLINTDVLVDGVHFSDATTRPEDVGWRAAAMNLSDLAASGAESVVGITIGLVAPGETPWSWVEGVYQGLSAALDRFGGVVLGGDCSGGQQRMLAVTAIGHLGPLRLLRSAAQPGDKVVVSGTHGLSRLGLALLQKDPAIEALNLAPELVQTALHCHQRPTPRLDALHQLIHCKPDGLPWRAGGTDSSDGLLQALKQLSQASTCQILLDPNALPVHALWPRGALRQEWCLNGGEDFELVLSLPDSWAKAWIRKVPESRCIGNVIGGKASVRWQNGSEVRGAHGFEHFTGA